MAELTGQGWPTQLAELLVELHVAVEVAKAGGCTKLPARRLASFGKRYDALVAEGKQLNPPPPRTGKRGRPALGPAGSLLARLETHRADVLRFATDFRVPFDNNQAERDVRMVKLQQKISGGWRSEAGANAFLDVRSYLSTARKHGQSAMVVLRDLFTDQTWTPHSAQVHSARDLNSYPDQVESAYELRKSGTHRGGSGPSAPIPPVAETLLQLFAAACLTTGGLATWLQLCSLRKEIACADKPEFRRS